MGCAIQAFFIMQVKIPLVMLTITLNESPFLAQPLPLNNNYQGITGQLISVVSNRLSQQQLKSR